MVKCDAGVNPIRYKVIYLFVAIAGALTLATCSNSTPKLEGTLLFHNYTSYESWDGQLFTVDLASKKLTNLTANWKKIKHTINGSFSHDGKYITFMGSEKKLEDWDVFITHWNGSKWEEPLNLTGPNNKRDEDPKFSPIDNKIIYKENGVIATIELNSKPKYLVPGSMPYFLPDGISYVFEQSGDIYLSKLHQISKMYSGDGIKSYYPIAINEKEFLYTRVQTSKHDGIMLGYTSKKPSKSLFFNNDQWDNSDPFPYKDGKRFIFLVSGDYSVPKGGYNLVVADLQEKKIINADDLFGDLNTDLEELGPAWTIFSF